MGSLLGDRSVVHDQDAVRQPGLGEAVRHDEGRAALYRGGGSRLQHARTRRAGLRCRLVEHHEPRVTQHHPGQGELLDLIRRQLASLLADDGVEPVGKGVDPPVRLGDVEGPTYVLVGGSGADECQTVTYRAGEGVSVLGDEEDVRAHSGPDGVVRIAAVGHHTVGGAERAGLSGARAITGEPRAYLDAR